MRIPRLLVSSSISFNRVTEHGTLSGIKSTSMGSPEALEWLLSFTIATPEWERNWESTGFANSSLELVEIHISLYHIQ